MPEHSGTLTQRTGNEPIGTCQRDLTRQFVERAYDDTTKSRRFLAELDEIKNDLSEKAAEILKLLAKYKRACARSVPASLLPSDDESFQESALLDGFDILNSIDTGKNHKQVESIKPLSSGKTINDCINCLPTCIFNRVGCTKKTGYMYQCRVVECKRWFHEKCLRQSNPEIDPKLIVCAECRSSRRIPRDIPAVTAAISNIGAEKASKCRKEGVKDTLLDCAFESLLKPCIPAPPLVAKRKRGRGRPKGSKNKNKRPRKTSKKVVKPRKKRKSSPTNSKVERPVCKAWQKGLSRPHQKHSKTEDCKGHFNELYLEEQKKSSKVTKQATTVKVQPKPNPSRSKDGTAKSSTQYSKFSNKAEKGKGNMPWNGKSRSKSKKREKPKSNRPKGNTEHKRKGGKKVAWTHKTLPNKVSKLEAIGNWQKSLVIQEALKAMKLRQKLYERNQHMDLPLSNVNNFNNIHCLQLAAKTGIKTLNVDKVVNAPKASD